MSSDRKPVQIVYVPPHEGRTMDSWDQLIVLCNDGTLWILNAPAPERTWERLPDIPQE